VASWNATPNGRRGGIWLSGCGLSADAAGNIYAVTGNGSFTAASGGSDYGDSVVKMRLASPDTQQPASNLTILDYFTPFNQSSLSAEDADLGSAGLMLIPGTSLGTTAGKNGTLYLLDTNSLGHFHARSDTQIVQALPNALGIGGEDLNFSTAAYFNGYIYYVGQFDKLRQFQLVNGKINPSPLAVSSHTFDIQGAQPTVSANGSEDGIVWLVERIPNGVNAVLHAYDAADVSRELYNSNQSGSRDTFGVGVKFSVPTVINGKVYVGSVSRLSIFGLLGQ
jgi:hypothetical protein